VEPARTVPEDAEASEILMVSAQEGAG